MQSTEKPVDSRPGATRPSVNTIEVFWSMVEVTGFCWNWTGSVTFEGYGYWWFNRATRPVHRIAFEELTQEVIPDDMHLDHLCRTRNCVNPDHLEVVTPTENSIRASRFKVERATCINGHDRSDPLSKFKAGGARCRQCVLVRAHAKRGDACTYDSFCSDASHRFQKGDPRMPCARGHSMEDSYQRPDGDGRQCRTCVRERTKKKWDARTMKACPDCGRVVSDINMNAHRKTWCSNNDPDRRNR